VAAMQPIPLLISMFIRKSGKQRLNQRLKQPKMRNSGVFPKVIQGIVFLRNLGNNRQIIWRNYCYRLPALSYNSIAV
jgi:hypothetical protein